MTAPATSRPVDAALALRAQLDQEARAPSPGLAWPVWLPASLRGELVDMEQMAMGAGECGGEIATRARLLAHDLRELCDWLDATKSAADGLKDAMRRRP